MLTFSFLEFCPENIGDGFCDFLFDLLYDKLLWRRGLHFWEKICSQREQILKLPYRLSPITEGDETILT